MDRNTKLENCITLGKRKGIYNEVIKECGCRVKSYVGGKVVVGGCSIHPTVIYHKCPSCGKTFFGKGNRHGTGYKEMKECAWSHAQ